MQTFKTCFALKVSSLVDSVARITPRLTCLSQGGCCSAGRMWGTPGTLETDPAGLGTEW